MAYTFEFRGPFGPIPLDRVDILVAKEAPGWTAGDLAMSILVPACIQAGTSLLIGVDGVFGGIQDVCGIEAQNNRELRRIVPQLVGERKEIEAAIRRVLTGGCFTCSWR